MGRGRRVPAHLALVTRAARCVSSASQRSSSSSKGWMWSLQQASNSAAPGCERVHVGPVALRPQSLAASERPRGLTLSSSASTLKLISAILSNGALQGQQGHRDLHQKGQEAAPSGPEGWGRGRHTAGSQPGETRPPPSPEGTLRPWGCMWVQLRRWCDSLSCADRRPGTWSGQAAPSSRPQAPRTRRARGRRAEAAGSLDTVVLLSKLLVAEAKLVHEGGCHLLDLVLGERLDDRASCSQETPSATSPSSCPLGWVPKAATSTEPTTSPRVPWMQSARGPLGGSGGAQGAALWGHGGLAGHTCCSDSSLGRTPSMSSSSLEG